MKLMYNNDTEKLFAEGGMNDEGGTVDPVSGNNVPAGSLQKEVRDDIPAQLSEGEFVIPADVVRYIGLDRLMQLRDRAKEGLAKMEEIGQMGNADQVENPEAEHGDDFSSEIDSIMGELEGEKNNLAVGGMPAPKSTPEIKQFRKPDGSSMFVTFFNGEPATTIPEGAQEITAANATQKASSSLTNTDKAVNKKTDTKDMSMFDEENIDQKFDKAFFDEVARFGMERKNKEISAKTTQAEVPAYKIDQELSDFSDALDYNLTSDMDSSMLSKSLDEAAAPAMEPAAPAAEPTAPAPEMAAPVEPPPEMAKGGLVRRRKK
jgi:hypothetical protein